MPRDGLSLLRSLSRRLLRAGSPARSLTVAAGLGLTLATATASSLAAQSGYRLSRPLGDIGISPSIGLVVPTGEFWDFTRRTLTVERALPTVGIGADVRFRLSPSTRLIIESGYFTSGSQTSAARGFRPGELFYEVLPGGREVLVEQETRLSQVPVRLGVAWASGTDGRALGSFAWRPAAGWRRTAEATIGFQQTTLTQRGDFVNRADTSVFSEDYRSRTTGLSARAGLGVERPLGAHALFHARTDLSVAPWRVGDDFGGFRTGWLFHPALVAGLSFRF